MKSMQTSLAINLCQNSIFEYSTVMPIPLEMYEDKIGARGEWERGRGRRQEEDDDEEKYEEKEE